VDVDLGTECGLRTCERLHAVAPALPTALLTSRWDLVSMPTARAAGAAGVIAKDRSAHEVLGAVLAVAFGGGCELEAAEPGDVRFVPREREILRLVGAGHTNAEIGAALFLAPGTIKHHMLAIFEKLDAPNRAAAVLTALRLGVLADHRAVTTFRRAVDAPATPVRVLVADRSDVRRAGVLLALLERPWVAARRGAGSDAEARIAAERLRPDVALVGDPRLSRRLVAARPGLRTLILSDDWSSDHLAEAVRGFCRRADGPGDVVATPCAVSPRERDVLVGLAAGATNPAIARELGMSPHTVKQHASSVFRKLGARNRAEAVLRADELGLLAA
jgi:DNA-binding NarL/FixJ family response regulator